MDKKTKKTKSFNKIILLICLITIIAVCAIVGFINKDNTKIENGVNIEGFDDFIEKNVTDTGFLRLVGSELNKNNQIEFCIEKIMKQRETSNVSVESILRYYAEIFGDDEVDYVQSILYMNNLNDYELDLEKDEFSFKEERKDFMEMVKNSKVKFDSKKIENNQIISKFKILTPKELMKIESYFVEKRINNENNEKYEIISRKLMDMEDKYKGGNDFEKEDLDYLFEIMEEDIDALAYVQEFEVVIEKLDDRFIIKDVKLI